MSTILFVEDSSICREPLAAMLRLNGYETICARDGREALAEIRRRVPDLVLLDIAMPEMDGLSFLRILRGQPQFRNIPVMLLTATTDRDCILKARELGVSGCLLKSHFSLEEMLSRIRRCLGEQPPQRSETKAGSATAQGAVAPAAPAERAAAAAPGERAAQSPGAAAAEGASASAGAPAPGGAPVRQLKRAQTIRRLEDCVQTRTLAGVVAEVIALASSPRCAIADLAEVLKKDPVLAARVIQVANTAAFATQKLRVSSVEEAVRNIGAGTVARMAASVGIFETFPPDASDGFNVVRCWQHSFAVAAIMEKLLPEDREGVAGVAYLAGLCHDLAEIVMRQVFVAEYGAVLEMAAATRQPAYRIEAAVLGIPHPELVGLVLGRLGLPENVVAPIREYHEDLCGQSGNCSQTARCLRLADAYAHGLLLASMPEATVGPVLVSECRSAIGRDEPPAIGDRELRSEVLTTTSLLARLAPEHAARVCRPLLPSSPLRVWYARHKGFSPLDPLGAALRMLAVTEVFDRLPAASEVGDYDAIVAAAPRDGISGFSRVELEAAAGGRAPADLRAFLVTHSAAPAPGTGAGNVAVIRAPVSLITLAQALAAKSSEEQSGTTAPLSRAA